MGKVFELFVEKIEKKSTTKAVVFVLVFLALYQDYNNKILLESLKSISILLIVLLFLLGIYYFYIKKEVKKFIFQNDCKEYADYTYIINCDKFDITIMHRTKCILWNGKPHFIFKINNKSNEIIENIEGYIDLFLKETCVTHHMIKIDYLLPLLAIEEVFILDDEKADISWETAKFILKEPMKIFSGKKLIMFLDNDDYLLIKNKTWHVMKLKLDRPLLFLNRIWIGGVYKIRRKDFIIRKKNHFFRFILIICGLLLIVMTITLLFVLGKEIYGCAKLHVNTYINLLN